MTTPAHYKAANRISARNATVADLMRTLHFVRADLKRVGGFTPWAASRAGIIRAELSRRA